LNHSRTARLVSQAGPTLRATEKSENEIDSLAVSVMVNRYRLDKPAVAPGESPGRFAKSKNYRYFPGEWKKEKGTTTKQRERHGCFVVVQILVFTGWIRTLQSSWITSKVCHL